jgi:outer membrane protein
MNLNAVCLSVAALILPAASASAQPPQESEGWSLSVGGGALFTPTYEGDDDYRLSLLPNIQIAYEDRFFASVQDGVGYNLINSDALRVGPIARVRFSRQEDGDQPFAITGERTTDLIGLGDVSTTLEFGAFAEADVGPLTASIEARQGVNGHDGFVLDAGLSYGARSFALGPPVIFSIGPRIKIVGDNYNDAYFSITPAQSLASGLSVYDADGGVHSYGVGGALIFPITRDNSLSAVMIGGYDRLAGDVGDAPLVRLRGSRNQATLGFFISYRLF